MNIKLMVGALVGSALLGNLAKAEDYTRPKVVGFSVWRAGALVWDDFDGKFLPIEEPLRSQIAKQCFRGDYCIIVGKLGGESGNVRLTAVNKLNKQEWLRVERGMKRAIAKDLLY